MVVVVVVVCGGGRSILNVVIVGQYDLGLVVEPQMEDRNTFFSILLPIFILVTSHIYDDLNLIGVLLLAREKNVSKDELSSKKSKSSSQREERRPERTIPRSVPPSGSNAIFISIKKISKIN